MMYSTRVWSNLQDVSRCALFVLLVLFTPNSAWVIVNITMTDDKISVIWPKGPEVDILKGESHRPLNPLAIWHGVVRNFKCLVWEWRLVSHFPLLDSYATTALLYFDREDDVDLSITFVQPVQPDQVTSGDRSDDGDR